MNNPQVERLAYLLWLQRGMPPGSPDEDWFLAEQLLRRQNERFHASLRGRPLFAFGVERQTR